MSKVDEFQQRVAAATGASDRKLPEAGEEYRSTDADFDGTVVVKSVSGSTVYYEGDADGSATLDEFLKSYALAAAASAANNSAQQVLVTLLSEVAVPGGISQQEFSRPGGWLERAQAVLTGVPVEMDLLKQLHEARQANDKLVTGMGHLLSAYAEVDELLDEVVGAMPEGLTESETNTQRASNATRDRVQQEYMHAWRAAHAESGSASEVQHGDGIAERVLVNVDQSDGENLLVALAPAGIPGDEAERMIREQAAQDPEPDDLTQAMRERGFVVFDKFATVDLDSTPSGTAPRSRVRM